MMKFSRFLLSRSPLSGQLLLGKAGNMKADICLHDFTSCAGISTAGNKIYAAYTLFKGKAFLSVDPNPPTLTKLDSGASKVSRGGCIFLTFCPAIGQRKYDFQRKQIFSLSPTEVGSLISLGPNDSCEFFHDPSMQTSNSGQVRKSFSVAPLPSAGGYMFSLNVVNNILKTNERFSVPVSVAEFAVLRTAFSFALPRIMGWDWLLNQHPANTEGYAPRPSARISANGYPHRPAQLSSDLEWDK